MIKLECPNCGKKVKTDDSMEGKRGKCPKCNKTLTIPMVVSGYLEPVEKNHYQELLVKDEENLGTTKRPDFKLDNPKTLLLFLFIVVSIVLVGYFVGHFFNAFSNQTESNQGSELSRYEAERKSLIEKTKSVVLGSLIAPRTAIFPEDDEFSIYYPQFLKELYESDPKLFDEPEETQHEVSSYVDAQNHYGALIRKKFKVVLVKDEMGNFMCKSMKFLDY